MFSNSFIENAKKLIKKIENFEKLSWAVEFEWKKIEITIIFYDALSTQLYIFIARISLCRQVLLVNSKNNILIKYL